MKMEGSIPEKWHNSIAFSMLEKESYKNCISVMVKIKSKIYMHVMKFNRVRNVVKYFINILSIIHLILDNL